MIALSKVVSVITSNLTHETLESHDADISNTEVELIRSPELCITDERTRLLSLVGVEVRAASLVS
jgi:hypothetical protein